MANQLFAGFLYTGAGAVIVGATVDLLDRNTLTPVRATTTTDSSGYWTISHATEGRFDVRITNGTSISFLKYDDQLQIEGLEVAVLRVRNPADTFDYDLVAAAIVADRTLNLPLITATDTFAVLGTGITTQVMRLLRLGLNQAADASARIAVTGQYFSTRYALTDGATIALDWDNGNVQSVTLGGNRTFTFANPKDGGRYVIVLTQDGTGSRTVTWPTIKWQGGSAPTLTTTAAKKDIITIFYDGTDYLGNSSLNH